jgi:hypothetical protein
LQQKGIFMSIFTGNFGHFKAKLPGFLGKFRAIVLDYYKVGKGGLEPPRLAAHDPKSCLSANSSTSPARTNYKRKEVASQ